MPDSNLETNPVTKTPQDLFAKLDELGIEYKTYNHEPVFTVEESHKIKEDMPGAHSKNLFLRNKKGQMWLFSTIGTKTIDLKRLQTALEAGRVSFGSPDRLMAYLGVVPGSVTPFAAFNDQDCQVKVVLDADFMAYDILNFHPLENDKTTAIAPLDLVKFLEAIDHPPQILDFPEAAAE